MNPKITSTKDMSLDYAKVVLYGPPGSGKTTMGASFPDVLFLSAESGLLSVRDKDIDVWTIEGWKDLEEAYEFLRKGDHAYKSVVIDSLTEAQKKLHEHIIREFPGKRRDYGDLMSQSDWGYAIDRMRKMCRAFRDLPMNVVFIALDQQEQGEDEVLTKPALSGKTLSAELLGWVDAAIYCPGPQKDDEGELRYVGQTVPAKGRMAKLRVPAGVNPPSVISLSFPALYRALFPETPRATKKEEAAA
jgi:DNA polymerase III delta prime subunit